jgi:hypothetical protein
MDIDRQLQVLADQVSSAVQDANKLLRGRRCLLRRGHYKGREADITGVIPDSVHGLRALAMVRRVKDRPTEHLNDRPESRQFWKLSDLELLI